MSPAEGEAQGLLALRNKALAHPAALTSARIEAAFDTGS